MKPIRSFPVAIAWVACAAPGGSAVAQDGTAFFESKIRPVLVKHCYSCHSVEAGKALGGLLLDSRQGIREGGDQGPAVVPGDPLGSVLFHAVSHAHEDLKMPLKKAKLQDAVIDDFMTWIQQGAPDPRAGEIVHRPPSIDLDEARNFWAYRKPVRSSLPTEAEDAWANDKEIDGWVLAGLKRESLRPGEDAPPRLLVRRLHYDLTGLPPSLADIQGFEALASDQGLNVAMAREVDRLLESERFGERWGRHWLDVARFAESSGKESNLTFPHAWRYRDYVIDAVHADLPFDRFMTEQIAGDLLPFDSPEERARLLTATGFLAVGVKGLNEMNKFQFLADLIDEQIDTMSRAVLASSIACARCHDHKFDPFSMEDYYALAGIFLSTETFFGTSVGSENNVGGDLIPLPRLKEEVIPNASIPPKKLAELKAKLAALDQEESEKKAAVKRAIEEGKDASELFTLADALRILWTRGGIEGRLETVDDEGKALPLCMGVQDRGNVVDAPLLSRGEISQPGASVKRAFPAVFRLDGVRAPPEDQSGRLELAKWLTHPEHPLTARVFVNRVWRQLFGAGLVRTVDNFGMNGEEPSHPELLDALALRFVEQGMSLKKLVRDLVLSHTYRQESAFRQDAFLKDPENRLLWRMPSRRLDAEAIRDSMLAVSGLLDLERPEASLVARVGDKSVSLFGFDKRIPADLDGMLHRSVYLPVVRDRLPDVQDLFDFAEPSLVTGDRSTTNVPLQALYLMNSPFVQQQAEALAELIRKTKAGGEGHGAQVRAAIQRVFGREGDPEEVRMGVAFLKRASAERLEDNAMSPLALYCQALLGSSEFRLLE